MRHTYYALWPVGWLVEVLLYVHRNRRFIRDGSPGRPPRLSHSSVLSSDEASACLLKCATRRGQQFFASQSLTLRSSRHGLFDVAPGGMTKEEAPEERKRKEHKRKENKQNSRKNL